MKNLNEILEKVGSTPEFLFKEVTDIHQRGGFGDMPLHLVCLWGDVDAVDILIQAGADVNARGEEGRTALFSAIMGKSKAVVKRLLDAHADLMIQDDEGNTALQFADLLNDPTNPIPIDLIELLRSP